MKTVRDVVRQECAGLSALAGAARRQSGGGGRGAAPGGDDLTPIQAWELQVAMALGEVTFEWSRGVLKRSKLTFGTF